MAVHRVWYSPDRSLRIELIDVRGRPMLHIIRNTMRVAELPPNMEKLGEWLATNTDPPLSVADLVED